MSKKIYTDEERRQRARAESTRYLKNNPEAQARKTAKDYARQKKRREEEKANRPKLIGRVCKTCCIDRPMEEYAVHGSGHKYVCMVCVPYRKKSIYERQSDYAKRNPDKIKAFRDRYSAKKKDNRPIFISEPKKEKTVLQPYSQILNLQGWRKIGGVGDMIEQVIVYMRGPIIMFLRGTLGTYSAGRTTFAIACDDTGDRYLTLEKAEKAAQKMFI